eukprot:scaffold99599_cov57-Phaeocystis_antarctica.AAC.2
MARSSTLAISGGQKPELGTLLPKGWPSVQKTSKSMTFQVSLSPTALSGLRSAWMPPLACTLSSARPRWEAMWRMAGQSSPPAMCSWSIVCLRVRVRTDSCRFSSGPESGAATADPGSSSCLLGKRRALCLDAQLVGRLLELLPRHAIDGRSVRIDRLHGDHVPRCEANAPLELGTHLLHLAHRLERHPRRWLGLRVAVVGGRGNGGGGRAVEEVAVVDFVAAEQEEGGLHRPLARRVGDVNGAAAVGVGEPRERGSGLDGLAEPGGVGGVGDDGPEEGGHRQRLGEQEGVQLVWGILARLDDELRYVRASSCPISGGNATSRQLSRPSSVRASSCPISGGSATSGQPRRWSWVRARSCPISGGSTSSGQPLRTSSCTRSSLHLTPSHERGLSPSGHSFTVEVERLSVHSCSAGLAARIARSASSSGFAVARERRTSSAISMARRPSGAVRWASSGVASTASPNHLAWVPSVTLSRIHLKKAGTASGLASRKACSLSGVSLRGSTMRRRA